MISAWTAVFTAIAVFMVPGTLVGWCAGLRLPWAISASLPITAGVFSTLAYIYGRNGTAVTKTSLIVGTIIFCVLCLLWRIAFSRARWRARFSRVFSSRSSSSPSSLSDATTDPSTSDAADGADVAVTRTRWERFRGWWTSPRRRGGMADPAWIVPLAGVITGASLILHRAFTDLEEAPDGLANVFQGWDPLWHASAIRYIMETGIGSSTLMGPLQNYETQDSLFYPTAWHVMGFFFQSFTGVSPVVASNVTSLVLPGVALPISAAFLGWMVIGRRSFTAALTAAFAAIICSGIVALFYIGYYVGAWPYLAGIAMVGICAALFMMVPSRPVFILPAGLALAGAGMMHPSVVTVVGMLVASWWLFYRLWVPATKGQETVWKVSNRFGRGAMARVRDVAYMAAALLITLLLVAPQFIEGLGLASEVQAFSDEQPFDRWHSWKMVLEFQTRHAADFGIQWWLLWLAAAGGLLLIFWRRNIWAPLAYLAFAVVAVHSVKHFSGIVGDLAGAVGSLHYNTTHRLILPVALLLAVFAAVPIAALIRLVFGGWLETKENIEQHKWRKTSRAFTVVGTAAAVVVAIVLVNVTQSSKDAVYWFGVAASREYRQIDEDEIEAYQWLAQQPHAYDGVIANNPNEGSGWMYPLEALPALHRHYLWPSVDPTSNTNFMMWNPNLIGAGMPGDRPEYANAVDFAAKDLGVTYIVVSPPPIWGFQKDIPAQTEGLWFAPGVTPVYKAGNTVIFAVNAAFTDAELKAIRAENDSPDPLPPLEPRNGSLFPRPQKWDRAAAAADVQKARAADAAGRSGSATQFDFQNQSSN